ncbi:hypothetical protein ACFVWN_20440 [Nocardiopsis flavescens]|uniref:hypothetical protein n=1 Tax=Nocardiopsis flavescens TaxID=758803 RepID=UPI00364E0679
MFQPLGSTLPGHRLFVPFAHVDTAATLPSVTADTMYLAGQTVHHLHIHVVPRGQGADGILLPWDHHTGCGCLCTGVTPLPRERTS